MLVVVGVCCWCRVLCVAAVVGVCACCYPCVLVSAVLCGVLPRLRVVAACCVMVCCCLLLLLTGADVAGVGCMCCWRC